jgi:hypothetical protein
MIYDKLRTIPDEDIPKLKKLAPFSEPETKVLANIQSVRLFTPRLKIEPDWLALCLIGEQAKPERIQRCFDAK